MTRMGEVSAAKVVTVAEPIESPLPAKIQEALGELVGAAREGLLAPSVGVGLGVVHELMELEVEEVVGPKGKHKPDRRAVRHGHEDGSMTLGGRRVGVRRPRMRTADGEHELDVAGDPRPSVLEPLRTRGDRAGRPGARLVGWQRSPGTRFPARSGARSAVTGVRPAINGDGSSARAHRWERARRLATGLPVDRPARAPRTRARS